VKDLSDCRPGLLLLILVFALFLAPALPPPLASEEPAPELACPSCDDLNGCTVDSCDTSTGTCRYEPANCDDGNPCTADSCVGDPGASPCPGVSGCCHLTLSNGTSCSDGSPCTFADHCSNSVCVGSPFAIGNPCDDQDACTLTDACNAQGQCVGTIAEGTDCDDHNPCTVLDFCDPSGTCIGGPVDAGTPCDDGSACTTSDACTPDGTGGIACSGTPVDCSDGNRCSHDLCDPATGQCSHPPVSCDDGNQCTIDACLGDVIGPLCEHAPRDGACQTWIPARPPISAAAASASEEAAATIRSPAPTISAAWVKAAGTFPTPRAAWTTILAP